MYTVHGTIKVALLKKAHSHYGRLHQSSHLKKANLKYSLKLKGIDLSASPSHCDYETLGSVKIKSL